MKKDLHQVTLERLDRIEEFLKSMLEKSPKTAKSPEGSSSGVQSRPKESAEEKFKTVLFHLKKVEDCLNFITEVYATDVAIYQTEATLVAIDAVARDALCDLKEATHQATYGKEQAEQGEQP